MVFPTLAYSSYLEECKYTKYLPDDQDPAKVILPPQAIQPNINECYGRAAYATKVVLVARLMALIPLSLLSLVLCKYHILKGKKEYIPSA